MSKAYTIDELLQRYGKRQVEKNGGDYGAPDYAEAIALALMKIADTLADIDAQLDGIRSRL